MKTLSFNISDVYCRNCKNTVKQSLERLPGVYHVNVSSSPSGVTLYYQESNSALLAMEKMVNSIGHISLEALLPQHHCDHINAHVVTTKKIPISNAGSLLTRLFRCVKSNIRFRLWNGEILHLGNQLQNQAEPRFTMVCQNANAIKRMVLGRNPLGLAEAYFKNDIDIEGDFFAAIKLKDHLQSINLSLFDKLATTYYALILPDTRTLTTNQAQSLQPNSVKAHSKKENLEAISYHYDVSNDFYALWLDKSMIYSCAYFEKVDDSLEQAQLAKLNHICRKLQLKSNDRLLDIGCGWGALIIHAAKYYGVTSHGITLSKRQFELANQRIAEAGLQDKVCVELRDYRDLKEDAAYDKISSVGMFEHIGLKNLPLYFETVNRLLKPTGLFLNHGITHFEEGWQKSLSTEFINRYVFPDGQLDTVSNIQLLMERAKFEIADVEALRQHYALTLRHWVARLELHHEQALEYVSESTYRIWRLYMTACALDFEAGEIGIYQILASKSTSVNVLPLTRQHLYPSATVSNNSLVNSNKFEEIYTL